MKRLKLPLFGILTLLITIILIRQAQEMGNLVTSRFQLMAPAGLANSHVAMLLEQQSSTAPQASTSTRNDVSQPLSAIPPIAPEQGKADPDQNRLNTLGSHTSADGPKDFVDPLWSATADLPLLDIPAPLQNFDGVNNVNGVLPPDTNGDVGPNHYMQWVNLSFAIYSKTGALLYGPAAGNTLWSGFGGVCQSSNDGDPIVQYDHLADRWMVSQFALPFFPNGPFYQCIAVSQTGDPTGAWYRYEFQVSANKMNDYPHFGVWPDGYYMSVNQFSAGALNWSGAGAVVFERAKMLQGLPAQMVYFDLFGVDPNLGGMLPSDLDGPAPTAGTPNIFAQFDDDAWGYSGDQVQLWNFHVDWTNTSNSTFTQAGVLPVAAFDSSMCNYARTCIPQQGTSAKLDALSDRLMYRLQYRNFGSYQVLLMNHTVDVNSTDRAGIRWYELRDSGSGWSIFQQGTFSPDTTQRWVGSIAMDGSGNIGLGYSASSSSMFPAIRYTGRLAGDPSGTMTQGEGTLFNGTGAQTSSFARWGDYSMLAIDPDGCTFWFTSEYLQTTSSASWRTRIGSFQLPGCSGNVTPTPTPTGPTPTPSNTPTPTNTVVVTPTPGRTTPTPGATETRPPRETPTPTATPGSTGTMHIGDLDASSDPGPGRWTAFVVITVHDAADNPLAGVIVTGIWSNGTSGSGSCVTDALGQCTISRLNIRNNVGSVAFTVTNATKAGFTYTPAANHDPDGDSNGTTITVLAP